MAHTPTQAVVGVPSESVEAPSHRGAPWALLAGTSFAVLALVLATRPILDIDLYWHLIVGDEIRAGVPISQAGQGWSFAPVSDTWVSSQWLAEVVLSRLYALGGFQALILYRALTAVLALCVVAAVTLRGRPMRAAVLPVALAAITLGTSSQERSQQLTYILAPLVGWWAERLVRQGKVPRWWLVLPLTVLWANFHGGWVLLPAVLVLAAIARVAVHGWRDLPTAKALLLSLGCGLVAMVSPLGPANAVTALAFSRAASEQVLEWGRVALWEDQGWQLGAVLLIAILCWSRGRSRPEVDELVLVLGLVAFGFLAYRNITPTVLILTPMLAGIISRARPAWSADPPQPVATRIAWAIAAFGAAIAMVIVILPGQDLHAGRPVALLTRLANHPGDLRAVNTYNIAGPLLWFGGGPTHVQVAIDGRSDRYGAAYIDTYMNTLLAARPGWQSVFDRLDPNVAVLYDGEALVSALKNERHWREVDAQDGVVVLVPPDATAWGSSQDGVVP